MDILRDFSNVKSKKELIINMEKEIIKGNVLDVGEDNHGIIYNLCKQGVEALSADYFEGNDGVNEIKEGVYDCLTMFFTMSSLGMQSSRAKLINEVIKYLKEDGEIIIWDVEKEVGKILNVNIKAVLPNNITKNFKYRDLNIFKECSSIKLKKLLDHNFDIIEFKSMDNIYYIKGVKKEKTKDEDVTSRSECEIYT